MAHPQSIKGFSQNQGCEAGEASRWPNSMEDIGHNHSHNHTPQRKSISVLAKVKEKAKKWRHTLTSSKKKHSDDTNTNTNTDTNTTPSWGVSLDDEDDDDPQHLGPPMYESEIGPHVSKQPSTKHPKGVPIGLDRSPNVLVSPRTKGNNLKDVEASPLSKPNDIKNVQVPSRNNDVEANHSWKLHQVDCPGLSPVQTSQGPSPNKHLEGTLTQTNKGTSPNGAKTMSKTMAEKAFATVSDATYVLASKLQNLALFTHETLKPEPQTPKSAPPMVKSSHPFMSRNKEGQVVAPTLPAIATKQASKQVGKTSPSSAPAAVEASSFRPSSSKQHWDKGVSVKEYILQKFEPGKDEKALSQVISKAMSPKKDDNDPTVIEKVREAVTSLLQSQQSSPQPSRSTYHSAQNSSAQFPPVTHVTDEIVSEAENLERLLQSN